MILDTLSSKLFEYTAKQLKLFEVLKNTSKRIYLVDGGSRSGKTVAICRWMILRCIKYPDSRRLIARQSKSSGKKSVWMQTLLPLLESDFDGLYTWDRTNQIINFHNGSSLWLGGFDNKQHQDDVLGQEWADIWINEGTDINYDIFGKLKGRLNVLNEYIKQYDYTSKFIIDCNPKGNGHWLNKFFIKKLNPDTNKKADKDLVEDIDRIWFHPMDNKDNLDPKYLRSLELLSGQNRKRFWDGVWSDQVQDAVFRFKRTISVSPEKHVYNHDLETWCSFDFGVSDPTFIIWYQIAQVPATKDNPKGIMIYIFDEYKNKNEDVAHYTKVIKSKHYSNVTYAGDPSGKNRNESLESWISKFRDNGINILIKHGHSPIEMIDNANEYMSCIRINEEQTPETLEMFENWEFKKDSDGKAIEGTPIHNEYSHSGSSFYYFMTNRFPILGHSKITIG